MIQNKTLCFYTYFQKNEQYQINLMHFLLFGMNDEMDYVFVINGECSIDFPVRQNIKAIMFRDNIGYDFMAYSHALHVYSDMVPQYQYFVFLNTSVRGPYVSKEKTADCVAVPYAWQNELIQLIENDDTKKTKLVGTTICMLWDNPKSPHLNKLKQQGFKPPFAHVQSQLFMMDSECLHFLKNEIFAFDPNKKPQQQQSFLDVIIFKEVMMSQLVILHGWNISCLAKKYMGIDYTTIPPDVNPTSVGGDSYYINAYFGKTLDPFEILFIKTNRDLQIPVLHASSNAALRNDADDNGNGSLINKTTAWIVAVVFIILMCALGVMMWMRFSGALFKISK